MEQVADAVQGVVEFVTANVVVLGMVVGAFITPAVTAVVQNPTWSKRKRSLVAGAASVVTGVVAAAAAGQFTDPGNLVLTVAAVLVASEAAYEKLWQPTGAAGVIERATASRVTESNPDVTV